MSYDPTQQKKWGLASLISLIATALLFFSFFLPWFGWSWSCNGSDCQAVTLSLKTHPPVSSGFSVASNGISLVSASASVPSVSTRAYAGDRGVIAVRIEGTFSLWFWMIILLTLLVAIIADILMNRFKTSERGLHTQRPTQGSAQPSIVPDSSPSPTKPWKKWVKKWVLDRWGAWVGAFVGLVGFASHLATDYNGLSLTATSAYVGDRAVFAVSTASFSFPLLWLVLVISIVLFLSQILMNLFKTVARWGPPFTLMITAVALFVEIVYMANAFANPKSFSVLGNNAVSVTGSGSLPIHATLTTSNPLGDATLYLSHGPSFGFWLGLVATLVVGGIAVVRVVEAYRASSGGRLPPILLPGW